MTRSAVARCATADTPHARRPSLQVLYYVGTAIEHSIRERRTLTILLEHAVLHNLVFLSTLPSYRKCAALSTLSKFCSRVSQRGKCNTRPRAAHP